MSTSQPISVKSKFGAHLVTPEGKIIALKDGSYTVWHVSRTGLTVDILPHGISREMVFAPQWQGDVQVFSVASGNVVCWVGHEGVFSAPMRKDGSLNFDIPKWVMSKAVYQLTADVATRRDLDLVGKRYGDDREYEGFITFVNSREGGLFILNASFPESGTPSMYDSPKWFPSFREAIAWLEGWFNVRVRLREHRQEAPVKSRRRVRRLNV